MSVTLAPSPWPAPLASRREGAWRFARELADDAGGWLFDLRRNVSISPSQLLLAYGLLCSVSLLVAFGFWLQGVSLIGWFTALELLAVGVAMVLVGRHAGDRECITLAGREVAVEQWFGSSFVRTLFRAEWLRIEPVADDGSLVELSGEGRSVRVGRHVRPELRLELATELRRALRLVRTAGERVVDHELKA